MPKGAPKGRRCTICQHPQRPNIDLAIATGISRRLIAARFKVSADAAWRHGREHLTPEIRAALATKVLAREGDMRRISIEEGTGVSATSLLQVLASERKASRQSRPVSLRVPPLILRRMTWQRMSFSDPLV
jgi:hypothetical protein